MRTERLRSAALTLFLTLAALGGCGSSDAVGPNADIEFLVGDWVATQFLLRNAANPESVIDVIGLGGSFRITVQPSGQYTAILSIAGQTSIPALGIIEVDGNELVLHQESPFPDIQRAEYTYQSDVLTLEGDTEIDVNGDGTPEPAILDAVLIRD